VIFATIVNRNRLRASKGTSMCFLGYIGGATFGAIAMQHGTFPALRSVSQKAPAEPKVGASFWML